MERGDGVNARGAANGLRRGFREAEGAHFARLNQPGHAAHRLFDGDVFVHAVLVVKINPLDAQPLQAFVAGLANVFRPAVDGDEAARAVADVSELGGEKDFFPPPANRPAHQLFVPPLAVNVGGIEEIHAELQRAMNHPNGLFIVSRPIEFRHAHAAKADGRNLRPVFAQSSFHHAHLPFP